MTTLALAPVHLVGAVQLELASCTNTEEGWFMNHLSPMRIVVQEVRV